MKSTRLATPVGLTEYCFHYEKHRQTHQYRTRRINSLRGKLSNLLGAALLVVLAPSPGPAITHATTVLASWYGPGFHGRKTASGERFNQWAMTAAHRRLPFGTLVRVTHKGRSVTVRINDRGPFIRGRHLDLSKGAARRIGCAGVCKVSMVVLGRKRR